MFMAFVLHNALAFTMAEVMALEQGIYFIICYIGQFIRKRVEEIGDNILRHCKSVLA